MVNSILDTTVLVDILRNYPRAIEWYKSIHQPTLGLTPFIWMELMSGAPNKQARLRAAKLMRRFTMIYPERSDLDWAM